MSLDVTLEVDEPVLNVGTGVWVRDNGATRELSATEVKERWPHSDIQERKFASNEVYSGNITHNLTEMANLADLYKPLWRPDENGIETAEQLIEPLTAGLNRLLANPDTYIPLNPPNGWGDYDGLVDFVRDYLAACKRYPQAKVSVSR